MITETLAHGGRAGVRVALAPILTDAPIIAVSLFVLSRLTAAGWILGLISMAGGVVVMRMGYLGLRRGSCEVESDGASPRSLRRGVIVNVLNPHPYIFWFSIGGPITVRAIDTSVSIAATFVALFYVWLVGSKLIVALVAARSRPFLKGRAYDLTVRALGLLLCLFAVMLIRDGIAMIGSSPF